MSKLRRIHVVIIGSVVCALVGVGMYFVLVKPAKEELAKETARYDQYKGAGTQSNVDQQKADYMLALREVADAQTALDKYMRAKMPNINLNNRATGLLALWHEQSEVLGPLLLRWIRRQNVRLGSSITIQAPPQNPNEVYYDFLTPIRLDLGRVRVEGNFKDIMAHLRKWNSCDRLVLIDLPSLSGQSPNLSCEYSLTVFLFPRTPSGEEIQMAGVGGGAGIPGMPGMPGMTGGMPTPQGGMPAPVAPGGALPPPSR